MPGSRSSRYALTGVVARAFSGLTGVGGGSIMVPLMSGQLRLTQPRAHGTSLAIIAFVAVAGAIGIAPTAVVAALVPSIVENASKRSDATMLKRIYGVVALILGVETIYSSARAMRARPLVQKV